MTTLTTAWMLGCACGFFLGVTAASRRRPTCRELMRNPNRQPTFAELLLPPPRDRDPDWRRSFNHENTNPPSGPPPLNFRRSKPVRLEEGRTVRGNGNGGPTTPKPMAVTVQGLNWPATLGDFTLVGPADNQGAWRWYERQHNGTTERVRVDHQLQPLGLPHPQ